MRSIADYRSTRAGGLMKTSPGLASVPNLPPGRKGCLGENKIKPKDSQPYLCSKRDGFLSIPEVKP